MGSDTIVCGHRGAPVASPENRIASMLAAAARGATWVEFDVRPAADDVLVVHHDPVTADGRVIAETSSSDLVDVADTFEALVAAIDLGLDVEVKTDRTGRDTDALASLVADAVNTHVSRERRAGSMVVTSFDWAFLDALRSHAPKFRTGLLFMDRPLVDAVSVATEGGHSVLAPWYPLVDQAGVEAAHAAGLTVATWTVNDAADIATVVGAGVDMIIGDDPAEIVAGLAAAG